MAKNTNPVDAQALQDAANQAAQQQAQQQGVADAQQHVNQMKAGVKANQNKAVNDLVDLVNLIVTTYQENTILKDGMTGFADSFIEKAAEGNGTRYIKHFLSKGRDFDPNKFIPDQFSTPQFKVEFIRFKKDNGDLADGSEQKVWDIVYRKADLITYFLSGQLNEFISEQILAKIGDSVSVYLYNKVMTALTTTAGKGKEIAGAAANLFDCLTTEILPAIEQMKLNSNEFNTDPNLTEAIDASHKDDLIMLVSPTVYTILNSHIMSQLFNSAKLDLYNYVGQIHVPNRKFNFAGDTINTEADNYIPDNKVIIIDKRNFYKLVTFLEVSGSQEFVNNMSHLSVMHLWLAEGYLPWGKVLTYTNQALTVKP